MKQGLSESDTRRAALVEFGGAEQVKELVRDVRVGHFFETRMQDLRFAFRSLREAPIFSLTVALVPALGIGSTALMFTIVNSVLLKNPPFPGADRLVMLWLDLPQEKLVSFSTREFTIWREQSQLFENMAAMTGSGFTITGRGEPQLVLAQQVTPSFFPPSGSSPLSAAPFSRRKGKPARNESSFSAMASGRRNLGCNPTFSPRSIFSASASTRQMTTPCGDFTR